MKVKDLKEKLPIITTIKEKFGSLRIYIANGSDYNSEINAWISFAGMISSTTCEVCGLAGEKRNNGWIRTLCDLHAREAERKGISL